MEPMGQGLRHSRGKARVAQWCAELESQHAAASYPTAVAALGTHALSHALESRTLVRVLPGTYLSAGDLQHHIARCRAVQIWGHGRLAIAGRSALHVLEPRLPAPNVVDVVAEPHTSFRAPGWVSVRRIGLPAEPVYREGLVCTPPAHAIVDAWHRAGRLRRGIFYEALWAELSDAVGVARELDRQPRVRGRRELARLHDLFAAGATSPLEVLARTEVFTGAKFRELTWQAEIVAAGRKRRADALHARARLVVELDGQRYHSDPRAQASDRQRDAELASAGFTTVRFAYADLTNRPAWCRSVLLGAIRTRLPHTT
jgi:very-short-patch-repair endonuclease